MEKPPNNKSVLDVNFLKKHTIIGNIDGIHLTLP